MGNQTSDMVFSLVSIQVKKFCIESKSVSVLFKTKEVKAKEGNHARAAAMTTAAAAKSEIVVALALFALQL